jgi:hypothetical protein
LRTPIHIKLIVYINLRIGSVKISAWRKLILDAEPSYRWVIIVCRFTT